MKIDLHTHTTASDGELEPVQLIKRAIEEKIDVISITDHDTVNALLDLEEMTVDIEIIPGIEISARDKCSVHILGYFIDIHNNILKKELEKTKLSRMKEIKNVIKKLNENVDSSITVRDIIKSEKNLSMNSVSDFLWKRNLSNSRKDSYDRYLAEGKIAYVRKECMTPESAIELITLAGGVPILAHPNKLKISEDEIYELIFRLTDYGLRGVEVYCRNMNEVEKHKKIYKENNLIITGGSDFHKVDDILGQWKENIFIPEEVYSSLLRCSKK